MSTELDRVAAGARSVDNGYGRELLIRLGGLVAKVERLGRDVEELQRELKEHTRPIPTVKREPSGKVQAPPKTWREWLLRPGHLQALIWAGGLLAAAYGLETLIVKLAPAILARWP